MLLFFRNHIYGVSAPVGGLTISSEVRSEIVCLHTRVLDLGVVVAHVSLSLVQMFTHGTGVGRVNRAFYRRVTIAASGGVSLNLKGSPVVLDIFNQQMEFARIKAVMVKASSGNTNDVLYGVNASPGAWAGFFGSANDWIALKPGAAFVTSTPDATGWPVSEPDSHYMTLRNAGAGSSVVVDLLILGSDV